MPTMDEYAKSGGYARDAQIANDVASRGIDSFSSPSVSNTPVDNQKDSSPSLPSWMGSLYKPVAGTDWYSTVPDNPNAPKYRADGTPVASIGYSNQQTGQNFQGYGNQDQFQQIINAPNDNARNIVLQDLIKSGGLVSNNSIYGNRQGGNGGDWYSAANSSPTMQSYTASPSAGYTKNPAIDALPIDQQLAYYRQNPAEAQQEIARAEGIGGQDAMDWANQLKSSLAPNPGSQQSAQAYINDPSSGQGGMTQYVAMQQAKWDQAVKSGDTQAIARLNTDMARVGYKLNTGSNGNGFNTDPINIDKYKTQTATIDDIAKKYGFDYSRDYANRQAEAEAQAKRNAFNQTLRQNDSQNKQNLQAIDKGVYTAADALDANTFLKQLEANQQQTNTGVNAGIAGDQNLRLAMNAQQQMGGIYQDANLARTTEQNRFTNAMLAGMEGLALTEQQKLAYADQLFNDRLQQGFGNAMQVNQFSQSENLAQLQAALQQRGLNVNMDQFTKTYNQNQQSIDFTQGLQKDQFDWGKLMDTAGLTGDFNGQQTVQEKQRLFAQDLAMQQFNRPYEQLTKYEQAQITSQAQARQAAASKAGKDTLFNMSATMYDSITKAYAKGTPEQKLALEALYPELKIFGNGGNVSADEQVFLQNLDPNTDTMESVNKELNAQYQAGNMTAQQLLDHQKLAKQFFDSQPKKEPGSNWLDFLKKTSNYGANPSSTTTPAPKQGALIPNAANNTWNGFLDALQKTLDPKGYYQTHPVK